MVDSSVAGHSHKVGSFLFCKQKTLPISNKLISDTKTSYERVDYNAVWIGKDNLNCLSLLTIVKESANFGLQPADYRLDFLGSVCKNSLHPVPDTNAIETDIRITAIAIHFFLI